ncbi:uncharacterized protein LOC132745357 [Ruditapes philippinarum]|uniref:uncharacterized protein LOC132745357 n=1 Tax=Ruditapes philippinarum TaxID=129788 RepID=UPI00295B19DC|nr:uncharacterized protein LOC132745357 [Ruditapes philippinarum]
MKILFISFICTALLSTVEAAGVCNETCTSSWGSIYVHYCKKGQECCGKKCMPYGADCCSGSEYCDNASTCCAGDVCCSPEKVCKNGACVIKEQNEQTYKHTNVNISWWYILLIIAVCVAFPVAVFIWKRRRARIRANTQPSRIVMVHSNPVHTPVQSTTVFGRTNGQPQNIAFIVTK